MDSRSVIDIEFRSLKSKISNKNLHLSSNFDSLYNIRPEKSSKASIYRFLSVSQRLKVVSCLSILAI